MTSQGSLTRSCKPAALYIYTHVYIYISCSRVTPLNFRQLSAAGNGRSRMRRPADGELGVLPRSVAGKNTDEWLMLLHTQTAHKSKNPLSLRFDDYRRQNQRRPAYTTQLDSSLLVIRRLLSHESAGALYGTQTTCSSLVVTALLCWFSTTTTCGDWRCCCCCCRCAPLPFIALLAKFALEEVSAKLKETD